MGSLYGRLGGGGGIGGPMPNFPAPNLRYWVWGGGGDSHWGSGGGIKGEGCGEGRGSLMCPQFRGRRPGTGRKNGGPGAKGKDPKQSGTDTEQEVCVGGTPKYGVLGALGRGWGELGRSEGWRTPKYGVLGALGGGWGELGRPEGWRTPTYGVLGVDGGDQGGWRLQIWGSGGVWGGLGGSRRGGDAQYGALGFYGGVWREDRKYRVLWVYGGGWG